MTWQMVALFSLLKEEMDTEVRMAVMVLLAWTAVTGLETCSPSLWNIQISIQPFRPNNI